MFDNDRPPVTSHGWIDDANVYRALVEEGIRFLYEKTAFCYVLRLYVVRYVDDAGIRVDRKDNALHDPDVRVL